MQLLDITEKKIMEDIISRGYKLAAQSFSTLTSHKVLIESTKVEYCTSHDYLLENKSHVNDLTVLQTDLLGDLKGVSFLIFTATERSTISQMSLAAFGNPVAIEESAVLLEIDNIISAAMITELSNAFNINVFGDVPRYFEIDSITSMHDKLNDESDDYYFLAHTNFIFEGQQCSPIFIWKMEKNIMNLVNQ